ncbi:hypothetical protein ACOME3_005141 [Neoechinorhynchus agilis]
MATNLESWENIFNPLKDEIQLHVFGQISKEREYVIGIDEAGRGPVLGPLIYCAFGHTKSADLSDSLTAEDRESVHNRLRIDIQSQGFVIVVACISPSMISQSMLRRQCNQVNLNELSHRTVELMLTKFHDGSAVFVDTVGPWRTYEAHLKTFLYPKMRFVVSEKADSKFACVSAASIVAKVCRDALISNLDNDPSGYPGDPKTTDFLKAHLHPVFGFDTCVVRFSWSTSEKIMDLRCYKVRWPNEPKKVKACKRPAPTFDIRSYMCQSKNATFTQMTGLTF